MISFDAVRISNIGEAFLYRILETARLKPLVPVVFACLLVAAVTYRLRNSTSLFCCKTVTSHPGLPVTPPHTHTHTRHSVVYQVAAVTGRGLTSSASKSWKACHTIDSYCPTENILQTPHSCTASPIHKLHDSQLSSCLSAKINQTSSIFLLGMLLAGIPSVYEGLKPEWVHLEY